MKKLFFASHNLDIGGIEKSLLNMLIRLDYNKYEVTLLLQEKRGIFLNDLPKEVKVEEYKISKCKITILRKILNRLKLILYILKHYNKYDFACAYATYDIPSTLISRFLSKNNCIFVHSDYTKIYDDEGFYNFFEERRIKKYKHIVFISDSSKNNFIKKYADLEQKTVVINNQVNVDEIKVKSKEKMDIKKNGYTFIFIGRLSENEKKLSRMIEAINELKDDNVYLWLIGDGPDKKEYEKRIKELKLDDKVLLLGKKHNPYTYLKNAESLLLSSDYEGFPVIYLEALYLKKQICTTVPLESGSLDISKYAHIVKDKNNLSKGMKETINNPKVIDFDVEKFNKTNLEKLEKVINDEI